MIPPFLIIGIVTAACVGITYLAAERGNPTAQKIANFVGGIINAIQEKYNNWQQRRAASLAGRVDIAPPSPREIARAPLLEDARVAGAAARAAGPAPAPAAPSPRVVEDAAAADDAEVAPEVVEAVAHAPVDCPRKVAVRVASGYIKSFEEKELPKMFLNREAIERDLARLEEVINSVNAQLKQAGINSKSIETDDEKELILKRNGLIDRHNDAHAKAKKELAEQSQVREARARLGRF